MKPISHVILSTIITAGFAQISPSPAANVICFLSGILIDLDHHIDYYLNTGKNPLHYRQLKHYYDHEKIEKIRIFFHGYEILVLLWFAVIGWRLSWEWCGLAVGMSTHFIADVLCNPLKPIGYSLIYRISKGFRYDQIFTQEQLQRFK